MKLLLYAGCLYLIGVTIVLLLQPSLMFREDGTWKEFGIGRRHHTWMPFWLFAIVWAILSYMIILLIASTNTLPGIQTIDTPVGGSEEVLNSMNLRQRRKVFDEGDSKPGYYILNTVENNGKKGVSKYVYLGPETPNLIYNRG